jgi:hypothetical protein
LWVVKERLGAYQGLKFGATADSSILLRHEPNVRRNLTMKLKIEYIVGDKVVETVQCAASITADEAKAIATKRLADINARLARIVDEDTAQEIAMVRR